MVFGKKGSSFLKKVVFLYENKKMEEVSVQNEVLTFDEIKKLYPDEWILLEVSHDTSVTNLSGIVLFHGKDYLELCYKGSEIAANILTKTIYTGEQNHNRKWLKASRLKDLPTTT